MKCFLPCFRPSKPRRSSLNAVTAHGALQPGSQLAPIDCIAAESKIRFQEQSNAAEVTYTKELSWKKQDQTAQIGEKKDNHDEEDNKANERLLQEEECSESLFSLSIGSKKQVSAAEKAEAEVTSPMQQLHGESEAFGSSNPSVPERFQQKEAKENTEVLITVKPGEEESSAKELINKPEEIKEKEEEEEGKAKSSKHPEHRYRDCFNEGYDDMNLNNDDGTWLEEESSESLFSLSTDSRKPISLAEKEENEVNSLKLPPTHVTLHIAEEQTRGKIPDASSSVLNPIENVTQEGRMIKATLLESLNNDKENINNSLVQDANLPLSPTNHSLKLSKRRAARKKLSDKEHEIGVDTSLSSWLVVEPEEAATLVSMKNNGSVGEQTPRGGGRGSPWSNEDRPILGALTVEEIRMFSLSTSSRRSRSRSPDETPIIGTVGSYWTHTGQNMDSNSTKSEKDAKRKSSSSALKTRLERAFEDSVCEA